MQLVYSSTCAVYGNTKQLPVTEATPPTPNNPYGTAKLAAEHAIRHYAASQPDFRSTILRYFNVYGSDPAGRCVWGRDNHASDTTLNYARHTGLFYVHHLPALTPAHTPRSPPPH